MERFVTIHGHFYQPPRENPWLEAVEVQDSAYPYHDWNARVTVECYAPNAASRMLDDRGRIVRIVNNYTKISFNFGPTLLAWMEVAQPEVYRAVLEADAGSRERFSGHGSALAQAHSHLILPLANRRDKVTQVEWGLRDFEHRFGRRPEGMWLPETAVDVETLDILAERGVRFTLLAPHQARRVRSLDTDEETGEGWREVALGGIDPSMPYRCRLASGRSIDLFFYDGPISRAVAFEGLLSNGEVFAKRLLTGFSGERGRPQLVHIATDGETYGHHHAHGEMALSYALHKIEADGAARLTNYGEHLEGNPPTFEVEILPGTSWSCAHGIERWRGDCGCSTGGEPGWNQRWRGPLREALDWLRDAVAPRYEAAAGELLSDPWGARDGYIELVLDRSPESQEAFFGRWAARPLDGGERTRALRLLELQRFAMYMYTSCGWFFNDLAGIETVQVLRYAGRALQLAEELFGDPLEADFLGRLEKAESNRPSEGTGRRLFERTVRPAAIDLAQVGGHYALSSLFEDYSEETQIYCYGAERQAYRSSRAGRAKVAVGRVRVTSQVTGEASDLSFGVLHFGDHNITGGVREYRGEGAFEAMATEVAGAFERADFTEVIRALDRYFEDLTYSLKSLFLDEQRKVLELILAPSLGEAEGQFRNIYDHYAPLMRFLSDLGTPLPAPLRAAAEVVLNADLKRAFAEIDGDLDEARDLLADTSGWDLELDGAGLSFALGKALDDVAGTLLAEPGSIAALERLDSTVRFTSYLPFHVSLWEIQRTFYSLSREVYPRELERAQAGDLDAAQWVSLFRSLGEVLSVAVE